MSEAVLIAIVCLLGGLAIGALIVFFMRPRAADALADAQRSAEAFSNLNTRLNDMASWLNRSQGQLQESVNQRLDAVTAHLGDDSDHIDEEHDRPFAAASCTARGDRRRAEKYHRSRHHGLDLAEGVRQQAAPRRIRPGPHGGNHRRCAAEGRIRIPVHAVEPLAARLLHQDAGWSPAGDRREISARGHHRTRTRDDRRGARRRRPQDPRHTSASISAISPKNT